MYKQTSTESLSWQGTTWPTDCFIAVFDCFMTVSQFYTSVAWQSKRPGMYNNIILYSLLFNYCNDLNPDLIVLLRVHNVLLV